ncbi:hypothetical protein ACH347_42275 [Saccharopolyspora sp. 5N102]|uniref:hypothetical protein n=1 Tax=Saccharopolyspora sp. 5N102 TaxID=3375155 RepID=UPI003791AFCB
MDPTANLPPGGPYEQVLSLSCHGETQDEAFNKATLWLGISGNMARVLDVSSRRAPNPETYELTIYFYAE